MKAFNKPDFEEAFKNVAHPGDEELFSCNDHESQLGAKGWPGKKWRSAKEDYQYKEAQSWAEFIWRLTPKAFHYYTPKLIRIIIDNCEKAGALPEFFLGMFVPDSEKEMQIIEARIQQYDSMQKKVLIDFFNYLRNFDVYCPDVIETAIENISSGKATACSIEKIEKWLDERESKYEEKKTQRIVEIQRPREKDAEDKIKKN